MGSISSKDQAERGFRLKSCQLARKSALASSANATPSSGYGGRRSSTLWTTGSSLLFPAAVSQCEQSDPLPLPPPPPPSGQAATSPPPPPAGSSSSDGKSDSIAEAAAAVSAYSSPGPYEQAAMEAKRLVSLDTFDGFRCDINKTASPFMAAIHSFWLGTHMLPDGRKSTYTFLTQVADNQSFLMARVDPGRGSVDGRYQRALFGGMAMAKAQMNVSTDGQNDQLLGEVDFGGTTWSGNIKYGSMGGGIVVGCNYLQALTPSLCMGGEGMYVGANQKFLTNYLLKLTIPAKTGDEESPLTLPTPKATPGAPPTGATETGSSTLCCQYISAQSTLALNYRRVVTPGRVSLGAELQCNPFTLDSQVLLGSEFKLQRSRVAVAVDGNGRIQTLVEAKLGLVHGSPTLNFSADMDHINEEMRFGYGLTLEG